MQFIDKKKVVFLDKQYLSFMYANFSFLAQFYGYLLFSEVYVIAGKFIEYDSLFLLYFIMSLLKISAYYIYCI